MRFEAQYQLDNPTQLFASGSQYIGMTSQPVMARNPNYGSGIGVSSE